MNNVEFPDLERSYKITFLYPDIDSVFVLACESRSI